MSTKNHRSGGKFCGNHTTLIPAACIVADFAVQQIEVSKILLGFIQAGLKPTNGHRKVKILDGQGSLLLSVRDNASHQEIRVFTSNLHVTKLAIARGARNKGLSIAFGKEE